MSEKKVAVGGIVLGGDRVVVQSMTTVKASDVEASVAQILRLERAGCELVRVAVADEADARALTRIRERVTVPIVADVHFSAKLAVRAAECGAHKLRINPGNVGGEQNIKRIADCLKAHRVPVRVGSNTGSIEPEYLARYGRSAEALVESALDAVRLFERYGVEDIVVSVKASDVPLTVRAYELLAKRVGYPLHVGVTEAGVGSAALVKSAVGIGSLLMRGIGDTIRVSLSADPVEEVYAAHDILRACGREKDFVEVIACPTCGRCRYDCIPLAAKTAERVRGIKKRLKVAVMGCVVNGPGEARECDLGIAGGQDHCVIFSKDGSAVRVAAQDAEREFFARLNALLEERHEE